eukprot:1347207-Prymnesium_polylepis.2
MTEIPRRGQCTAWVSTCRVPASGSCCGPRSGVCRASAVEPGTCPCRSRLSDERIDHRGSWPTSNIVTHDRVLLEH